jgi:hypothetical protein
VDSVHGQREVLQYKLSFPGTHTTEYTLRHSGTRDERHKRETKTVGKSLGLEYKSRPHGVSRYLDKFRQFKVFDDARHPGGK